MSGSVVDPDADINPRLSSTRQSIHPPVRFNCATSRAACHTTTYRTDFGCTYALLPCLASLDFGDTRLSRVCLVTAFGHAHPISLNHSSPSHSSLAAHLKSHRIALRFNSPLTHLHHSALPVRDYLASSELIFPMHPEISTREPSPRSVTWMAYYARHSEPTKKKLPHSASCWAIVDRYSVVLQCVV